jgi:hypothetical protein
MVIEDQALHHRIDITSLDRPNQIEAFASPLRELFTSAVAVVSNGKLEEFFAILEQLAEAGDFLTKRLNSRQEM